MVDIRVCEVYTTFTFRRWFSGLRDLRAKLRIEARILKLELGDPGDAKPIRKGLSELRIDYGPGYRLYFVQRGNRIAVLLAGGDKTDQKRDIATALALMDDEEVATWRSN